SATLESVASAKLIPERTSVWAGEVFGLNYELSASRRTNPQITPVFDWNAAPLVVEDWSKPEVTEVSVNGDRRLNVLFRTPAEGKLFDVTLAEDVVLVPTKPGTYTLGPVAFTFFDPKTGAYVTKSAPRTTVTITSPTTSPITFGGKAPITEPSVVETPAT